MSAESRLRVLDQAIQDYVAAEGGAYLVSGWRLVVSATPVRALAHGLQGDSAVALVHLAAPGQPWHVSLGLAVADADHLRQGPMFDPEDG